MSEIGHNSGMGGETAKQLREYVDRLERLHEEKAEKAAEYAADIKDLTLEIKGRGFDMKAVNEQLRRRKWAKKNEEAASVLETYEGVFE